MKSIIKSLTKNLLDKVGLELRKTRPAMGSFPGDAFYAQKEFLDHMNVRKPVIFDVGAHKGETVRRYKELFQDSNIYCFEPFPDNVNILRSRFSSDPSVHVFDKAVSDTTASRTFHINESDATNSLLPRTKSGRRYFSKAAAEKTELDVETITIDEVMKLNNINNIDILKFDIQGGELMALLGAENALRQQKISVIYTEALFVPHYENNPLLRDLWNTLEQYGYTLFDIYDLYRATNGQLRFADAIFISKEVRSKVLDSYKEEP
jgi:FkbM family methyltransferase